jgi:hypothetical protein
MSVTCTLFAAVFQTHIEEMSHVVDEPSLVRLWVISFSDYRILHSYMAVNRTLLPSTSGCLSATLAWSMGRLIDRTSKFL